MSVYNQNTPGYAPRSLSQSMSGGGAAMVSQMPSGGSLVADPSNFYGRQERDRLAAQAAPVPVQATSGGSYTDYNAIAAAAERERQLARARAAERQRQVTGGYDAQIAASRAAGEQGYARFSEDYKAITADALATRERNMARVDQYGASMRDDLNRKNYANLVAAGQSAIKRGLGNMTIYDSLRRGANFDNTRQVMSLEDQLLQNRISTDSGLSKSYQDVLQTRAQGLANQWNQNTQNDNQLNTGKLSYIGGIQEPDNYRDISNIYMTGLQQQNANQQAQYDREFQAQQAQLNRAQNQSSYSGGGGGGGGLPSRGYSGQPKFQVSARSRDTF